MGKTICKKKRCNLSSNDSNVIQSPTWSGLSQERLVPIGHAAAQQVLRGKAAGLVGFAVFYTLSLTLTRTGYATYGSAVAGALGVQGISLLRMRQPVSSLGE
jgi:hypothetical protein